MYPSTDPWDWYLKTYMWLILDGINVGEYTVRPMDSSWVIIYCSSSPPRRTEMAVDGVRQCVTTEGCYNQSLLHSGKLEYADAPWD